MLVNLALGAVFLIFGVLAVKREYVHARAGKNGFWTGLLWLVLATGTLVPMEMKLYAEGWQPWMWPAGFLFVLLIFACMGARLLGEQRAKRAQLRQRHPKPRDEYHCGA